MSFRRRLVLSCGAAVALVVVLGCGLAYWVVRDTLRAEIDNALRNEVAQRGAPGEMGAIRRGDLLTEAPPAFVTEIRRTEGVTGPPSAPLADDEDLRAVAEGRKEPFFADRQLDGVHVRVHVARLGNLTLFVARPLTEVDSALRTLRNARSVVTRELALEEVWGGEHEATPNAVDRYVGYLRRKLGEPRLIQTVRGVGYVLREQ